MLQFLTKLFSSTKGKRTVVILNDDGTEEYTSHKFKPRNLRLLFASVILCTVVLVVFLMIFTPVGGFIYNQRKLRKSLISMQQRIEALQDSIRAQGMQLANLRQILFSGKKGVFPDVEPLPAEAKITFGGNQSYAVPVSMDEFKLPHNAMAISKLLQGGGQFPARWPVDGTLTRGFNLKNGHYGIDIAADKGEYFRAVADGVVIGRGWNINYGNVLYIQHRNGIIIIYKHAGKIRPEVGDIVSKGEILGRVGDTGIISSGPHLHMELWANGIPQNPLLYLINP